MARLRLRKVLMVVRVVSAWRDLAGRLLLPTSRRSSRLSQRSGMSVKELEEHQQEMAEKPNFEEKIGLLMESSRSLQSTPPPLLLPINTANLPSRGGSACSLACTAF